VINPSSILQSNSLTQKCFIMKTLIILLVATFATVTTFAQKSKANNTNTKPPAVTVQYSCPMHPDMVSNKPGKCSKCGMDLTLSKKEELKHDVTNTYACPMHQEVVSNHEGICAKCSSKLVVDRRGSKQATTIYSCSMHQQVASNETGKCPICGQPLQKQTAASDSTKARS
jgi:putative DNA topoisomerase